jgi:tetratricopeptide (TPR) repeat protein
MVLIRDRRLVLGLLFRRSREDVLKHPTLETIARLKAGDLSHEELLAEVLPHLLEKCSDCRRHNEEILKLQKEVGHWDERVAVLEGLQAPELLAKLREHPFDRQVSLVVDDVTFQTWGLCQLLLKESLESAFDDAGQAVNFAELGVRVSQTLGEAYDPAWVLDLQTRAYAYFGNAQRVLGELRGAETAFRDAEALLAQSTTGNDLITAEVVHLKSSLLRAQRRLEDAQKLADQALAIYREHPDTWQEIGGALLSKARILEVQGNLSEAATLLGEAVGFVAPRSRLGFCVRHNLLNALVLAGRYEEATGLLPEAREAFEESGKTLDRLRLRWLEGKIAMGLGRLPEAEEAFRRVQEEFLTRNMGYDAALVSLDLAVLYAQEHRTGDLKQLATEILLVFESRDVHREAVATLLLFQRACEEERLTAELARQLASQLQLGG